MSTQRFLDTTLNQFLQPVDQPRHQFALDIASFIKHMMGRNPSLYAIDLNIKSDKNHHLSLEPIVCCREGDNILLPNGTTIYFSEKLPKEEAMVTLEGAVEIAMTTYVTNKPELLHALWHLGTEVVANERRIIFHLENESDARVLKLTDHTPNIIRLYLASS